MIHRLATQLQSRYKSGGNIFGEKVREIMKNYQSQGKTKLFWKMLTSHILFPYLVKGEELSVFTFCYTADLLESGGGGGVKSEKAGENKI